MFSHFKPFVKIILVLVSTLILLRVENLLKNDTQENFFITVHVISELEYFRYTFEK